MRRPECGAVPAGSRPLLFRVKMLPGPDSASYSEELRQPVLDLPAFLFARVGACPHVCVRDKGRRGTRRHACLVCCLTGRGPWAGERAAKAPRRATQITTRPIARATPTRRCNKSLPRGAATLQAKSPLSAERPRSRPARRDDLLVDLEHGVGHAPDGRRARRHVAGPGQVVH